MLFKKQTERHKGGDGSDVYFYSMSMIKQSYVYTNVVKEVYQKDGKEELKLLKNAFQNNAFDTVKRLFERLVWNDRNGISSREYFVDEEGNSPMFWACGCGNESLVKMLVEKYKFPVNDQNYEGFTALIVAVMGGYSGIVEYLLKKGANPNICNLKRESPLHFACCLNLNEICEELLKYGAWIEAEDECGETPLHWAVREENIEVTETLLRNGANPDHTNEEDETPRDYSNLSTCQNITQLLDSFAGTISFSEIDSIVSDKSLYSMQMKDGKQKEVLKQPAKEVLCK